jgi:hypothetical protein
MDPTPDSTIASTTSLSIPTFLCARARTVRSACRRFARKLVDSGSWDQALQRVDFIDIQAAPLMLVLYGPPMDGADDLDNVMLYPFVDEIGRLACVQEYRYQDQIQALLLEGMSRFWGAIALLASAGPLLPVARTPEIQRSFSRDFTKGFLRWWDQLCELDHRFYGGDWLPKPWPEWGRRRVFSTLGYAGMPRSEFDALNLGSAKAAASRIQAFLDTTGPETPH